MIQKIKENPFLRFLVLASSSYLIWYWLYNKVISPMTDLNRLVIDNLIELSSFTLKALGYQLIPEPPAADQIRTVGIDGTYGLWIGDPCNGITLFALFTLFIFWYPGPWKKKMWFIPFGLISIHLINVLRIVALCIIVTYDYAYLDFNHNYTFTIVVNGYMFLLWIIWATKFSDVSLKRDKN
ncbi:MAG: archaeosortase/exosortase family protein [Flavobacteriales bacterium]|nr:archaeosortase/exosortase family protein [Flavobacteriales bacterium]